MYLQRPIGYDNTIHRKVAEIAAITENKCKLKTVSSKKADAEAKRIRFREKNVPPIS